MNQAPSLQERVGNRYWDGSDAMARAGVAPAAQAPARGRNRPSGAASRAASAGCSPRTPQAPAMMRTRSRRRPASTAFALDERARPADRRPHGAIRTTNAAVSSVYGNGRIRAEGAGVGATATWYGDDGLYVDGQAQSMFYRGHLSSDVVGTMVHGNEGVGYTFSVESGKRFGIGNGFLLTPQAQLAYAKVAFDEFHRSLRRQRLAGQCRQPARPPRAVAPLPEHCERQLRHRPLRHLRDRQSALRVSRRRHDRRCRHELRQRNDRLWGSIGGGGSHSWANGRYSVFGEVTYRASLQHAGESHGYKGTGGFRVTW